MYLVQRQTVALFRLVMTRPDGLKQNRCVPFAHSASLATS